MRLVLLAWVAGVWWLQQASALPSGAGFGAAVGAAAAVLVVWAGLAVRTRWRMGRVGRAGSVGDDSCAGPGNSGNEVRHRCAMVLIAVCVGVFGYAWAALRAEIRLSDRLPVALAGQDLIVEGVVAGLPATLDGGVRFAFDVERAYVASGACEGAGDRRVSSNPASVAGWRDERGAGGTQPACTDVPVPRHIELVWSRQPAWAGRRNEVGGPPAEVNASHAMDKVPARGTLPRAGERWRLPVRVNAPRGFANWHGFDAELMALVRGIRASGYVRAGYGQRRASQRQQLMRLEPGPVQGYRWAAWRERLRDDFRAALRTSASSPPASASTSSASPASPAPSATPVSPVSPVSPEPSAFSTSSARYGGVLMALALGERSEIAPDDWQVFADTGVSHLLAISGLHVSLVAGALGALVGLLWRRAGCRRIPLALWWPAPKAAAVAGLLAAIAYGAVAGWGVPARRAVGMVTIVVVALLNGRFAAPSYALAWALAVIVALDPWAVVAPGLWLSFGAVAALVLAGRRRPEASGRRRGTVDPARSGDPGAGRHGAREADRHSAPRRAWTVVARATRAQFAVTIGMVPLSLAWFGAVPLLGPIANAVAIPVMTLVVTPLALLSLVLPAVLAQWTLAVAHWAVVWLAEWLGWLASSPGAVWRAGVAPTWVLATAVAGAVVVLMPFPRWMRGKRAGCVGWRFAGLVLMGPAWFASPPRPGDGDFRVTMLDVGQGNAVLVETATRTLLFDAGPPMGARTDAGRRVIVPYLRAHGVRRLDRLVVSHAHDDHFGGARSVLRAYPDAQVFSSLPGEHRVRRAARDHRTCLAGQQWTWEGVTFRFLHPDPNALRAAWAGRAGPNSVSCVLKVSNERHSALLAADAEAPQERTMLARFGSALHANVLLAPHHGSQTSSTMAFVQAVAPEHVVFQTGYRNRFRHPRPSVVERYRAAGATVWDSAVHGAVRFSLNRDGIEAKSCREQRRRYWHAESFATP